MEQRPSSVSQLHQTRSRGEKAGQRTERHHPSTRNIHITHITDPETVDTAGSSKINFQSHLCRLTVFTFVRHLEHSFVELRPPLIITHLGQGPATVRCICPVQTRRCWDSCHSGHVCWGTFYATFIVRSCSSYTRQAGRTNNRLSSLTTEVDRRSVMPPL